MAKVGRPSSYNEETADVICKHAYKLALLGATDVQLANFFDVSHGTIDTWKKEHAEFLGAINKGKDEADANVSKSLYRRAMGYSHRAVKIFQHQGEIIEAPYIEHYPPDTTACIFWLKNRQTAHWRDKTETDVNVVGSLAELIQAGRKRVESSE
jgi:hypothetical protein